jgi:hypothetical protein
VLGVLSTHSFTHDQIPDSVRKSFTQRVSVKPKDLLGIPWLFAIAARADGWYLRSDIIWAKKNCMPESVVDRPTKSHEYVFLLAKSEKYFYDAEAVREHSVDPEGSAKRYEAPFHVGAKEVHNGRPNGAANTPGMKEFRGTRNLRTVWNIATPMYRLRDDLTAEQRAYVLQRIVAADSHSACSTRENNI